MARSREEPSAVHAGSQTVRTCLKRDALDEIHACRRRSYNDAGAHASNEKEARRDWLTSHLGSLDDAQVAFAPFGTTCGLSAGQAPVFRRLTTQALRGPRDWRGSARRTCICHARCSRSRSLLLPPQSPRSAGVTLQRLGRVHPSRLPAPQSLRMTASSTPTVPGRAQDGREPPRILTSKHPNVHMCVHLESLPLPTARSCQAFARTDGHRGLPWCFSPASIWLVRGRTSLVAPYNARMFRAPLESQTTSSAGPTVMLGLPSAAALRQPLVLRSSRRQRNSGKSFCPFSASFKHLHWHANRS
ncbi:hypothetical protein BD413DRAFT_294398 [Trametes elegans]|nr:hypothetical protein BD413DRAFT_294398 [Trametes elegans]